MLYPANAPYRVVEADAPVDAPFVAARSKAWPMLGPALAVFAVVLWTFVVAGQFTTSWSMGMPMNQGVAVGFVLALSFIAWVLNVRRSRDVVPPKDGLRGFARAIGIGLLSLLFFFLAIFASMIAGSAMGRGSDFPIAFVLVLLSLAAALLGPRLTSPARPVRTHRERFFVAATWALGVVLTLVAGIDLAANG